MGAAARISYIRRGVEPPDKATPKRPRLEMAVRDSRTNSSAAAVLTASASGYLRIVVMILALFDFKLEDLLHPAGMTPPLELRLQPDADHPLDELLAKQV